jgi:anaerobic magnesium-protoporphyrin IX monomethyl ester cyclase
MAEPRKLRVLFVDIPYHREARIAGSRQTAPPFVALAAVTERAGYPTGIIDPTCDGLDDRTLLDRVVAWQPDVVGLTTGTALYFTALALAEAIRSRVPGATIILGGEHFSFRAEETLELCPAADLVVAGEGEETLLDLLAHIEGPTDPAALKNVPGLVLRAGAGEFLRTAERPLIESLDSLPVPAYHLAPTAKAQLRLMFGTASSIGVKFARGCQGRCSFCPSHRYWRRTCRELSARRGVEEMELLATEYGKTHIMVGDDDLFAGPGRMAEMAELLLAGGKGITWMCHGCVNTVLEQRAMLPLLRRSGLSAVILGVESPSRDALRFFGKRAGPEQALEVGEALRQAKIGV